MSKPASHERDQQILDLLDGNLPEDRQAELRNWLDQSSEHYDRFVELSFLHSQLAGQLNNQRSVKDIRLESLQAVPFEKHAELPPIHLDATALTKQKYASALSYVLRHTFTPRRVAVLAIAAALLLAVTLLVVFIGDNDTANTTPELASPPREPGRDGPAHNQALSRPIVATLTNDQDAVWDHRPGEDLYAGQRFVLTQGLAEITTARGAIAILEAPATIELLNSDNALHLHAGKLVGICETDSSKGFLVRTAALDITDLGTRFGVDASRTGNTEVHVYEGIVEVDHASATHTTSAKPQRLIAGQALQAKGYADDFVLIEIDAERFAAIMPTRIELPGTGQGLALNDTDPNWRVTAIDGKPLDTPGTMTVRDAHERADPPFLPNDPQTSQWLIIDGRLGQSGTGPVTFTCQSRFEVPPGVDASAVRLIVSFDADDSVTAVRINGHAVAVPKNEFMDDSRDLHVMTIRRHLVTGQNTIEFDVMDRRSAGFANSGLRVKLSLQPNEWENER